MPPSAIRRTKKKEPREWANPQGFEAITGEYTERITILSQEAPMRALSDADVEAIRSAFDSVLAALPQDRLRNLVLELMFSPFTTTTQHRKRGRPRKHADEGNVVSLHQRKPGRKRRRKSVDAAKLAARRKRYAANRRAKRQAARAAKAIKAAGAAATATNGQDVASIESFWKHAQCLSPQTPWKRVASEFGVNENAARHAFKSNSLPPRMGPMSVERFLALR